MALKALKVAIIGGGIGGLTAAIALRQKGASVTLFEKTAEIGAVGAGIQISANALRVLHALGLKPSEWPHTKPRAAELRDYKLGRLVAKVALNTAEDAPYLQFHRADLIHALLNAAKAVGVGLELGVKANQTSATVNTVGINGQKYDLAVSADGVRSSIRDLFYDGQKSEFTGNIAWRALVPAIDIPTSFNLNTHIYMGPKKHIVIYPLRGGEMINIVAVEERDTWISEGWNQDGNGDDLRRIFSGWCPDVAALLQCVESPNIWGLFSHPPLHNWSKGRVVLLGDSAHPMVPFLAQGACMAIEDAWVLADQLDKNDDIKTALSNYQDIRKPRATKVQETALRSGRIYHVSNPISRAFLHTGISLSSKIAPSILSRQFDWIYTHDVTAP